MPLQVRKAVEDSAFILDMPSVSLSRYNAVTNALTGAQSYGGLLLYLAVHVRGAPTRLVAPFPAFASPPRRPLGASRAPAYRALPSAPETSQFRR